MKTKRILLDAAMVILLPLLMAYSLIGEAFHEIAGTLMLCLFLTHHWLNRGWWKTMLRGKHSAQRVFRTALDLLLLVFMIVQPLCGILMSKHSGGTGLCSFQQFLPGFFELLPLHPW